MTYPNISRAIDGFLLYQSAGGRSHYTIRNYRNQLNRLAKWIEDIPINEVTSRQLETFMIYLREDFRITHRAATPIEPRKLSAKTVKNAWGALSSFWNWVEREYEIGSPFCVPTIKAHTKPIYSLKKEEVDRIVKACKHSIKSSRNNNTYKSKRVTAIRDKAIVMTLLDTGVRASELLGINVGDMELDSGRIYVTGKGDKSRFVYLGRLSKQAVWRYLAKRFPDSKPPEDDPLFVNYNGIHKLTTSGLAILLKRLGKRAYVSNVHPHRFRHTFAVEFLRNGGNVFELQQLLGHSDLGMVKRYVRLSQIDLEVSIRRASPADNWRL